MKCPRCRHENPPQAKFCEEYATPRWLGRARTAGRPFQPPPSSAPPALIPLRLERSHGLLIATPLSTSPEKILASKSALERESACYSVLRMQDCVKRSAEEVPRSNAAVVKISVGRGCRARQRQRLHIDDTVVGRRVGV